VVGFGEEDDVRVVGGGEVVDVEDGGAEAKVVEVGEV
jgi:hypothetical protein